MDSGNRGFSFWPRGSMPGQKSIRLAKKGGYSIIPRCGLLRFVAEPSLSPRVSLRKEKGEEEERWHPGRFCLRRLPSCPGNDKTVLIHQRMFLLAQGSYNREKWHSSRQKRGRFLYCQLRASTLCCRVIPFPPRLFAEREGEGIGKVASRPFLSSPPALLPGQR